MSTSSLKKNLKIIDTHLHVWANEEESKKKYPYSKGQEPPTQLKDCASTSSLLEEMEKSHVDGALIVQPINHKFDHSYVTAAIAKYPSKLKGMLLHDPSLSPEESVNVLEDLVLKGFVGVRFNPYLWPEGELMSSKGGSGVAVYKRCGELKIPVGVMCFKGLDLHYDDIVNLLETYPETPLIIDHFGFTKLDDDDKTFQQLLSLKQYPSVYVKISALFRISQDKKEDPDQYPKYENVRLHRFVPLLEAFGADRLMFGTDFPFVLEQKESYDGTVHLVKSWGYKSNVKAALMGGTAEKLFGFWGNAQSS